MRDKLIQTICRTGRLCAPRGAVRRRGQFPSRASAALGSRAREQNKDFAAPATHCPEVSSGPSRHSRRLGPDPACAERDSPQPPSGSEPGGGQFAPPLQVSAAVWGRPRSPLPRCVPPEAQPRPKASRAPRRHRAQPPPPALLRAPPWAAAAGVDTCSRGPRRGRRTGSGGGGGRADAGGGSAERDLERCRRRWAGEEDAGAPSDREHQFPSFFPLPIDLILTAMAFKLLQDPLA